MRKTTYACKLISIEHCDIEVSFYLALFQIFLFQATISGDVHTPSKLAWLLGKDSLVKGSVTNQSYLPPMVRRKSRAPFLFKFCRVAYNKEGKRLQIQDGVFVGKSFRSGGGREDVISDEQAALHLEMEESLSPGIVLVWLI